MGVGQVLETKERMDVGVRSTRLADEHTGTRTDDDSTNKLVAPHATSCKRNY